jgi:hypothetical protein
MVPKSIIIFFKKYTRCEKELLRQIVMYLPDLPITILPKGINIGSQVPSNITGSCGMMLNLVRRSCSPMVQISVPSINTCQYMGPQCGIVIESRLICHHLFYQQYLSSFLLVRCMSDFSKQKAAVVHTEPASHNKHLS